MTDIEELQKQIRKTVMKSIYIRTKNDINMIPEHERVLKIADARLDEVLRDKRSVLSMDEVLLREYSERFVKEWDILTVDNDGASIFGIISLDTKISLFRKMVLKRLQITNKKE